MRRWPGPLSVAWRSRSCSRFLLFLALITSSTASAQPELLSRFPHSPGLSQIDTRSFMAKTFYSVIAAMIAGLSAWLARAEELPPLTLQQAHESALRNHPLISVAD